jgi:thiol-disulfide isomerase/thioredoxin
VLVVDLAAVWCEPCYDLAPQLQALQEEHGAAGLTVVTMIVQNVRGANPTVDDAADWVAELGVSYPVVADVLGIRHVEWLDDPRVLQVPRTVVADRDGIVRGVSASADGTALEELAVELL